jgi:3-methylcrotonyl-CoA carboxylase alpha subunit/geranyl-CoA carboxylase alpha subunit
MKKLLIANRGEIARRVIRTAHAMGIDTVAVYSDVDRTALHVRDAGTAVALGGNASSDTYLRIDKLLDAARVSGADAVHPGYGFLSERAEFAQAVTDAGLIWVGPPASAIRALGSKAAAKQLALANGVPCLPGYHGEAQDDDRLQAEAQRIGLPLMVKAVAGGGGRGMRLVTEWTQLLPALKSARSEALSGFGCGDLLLERALLRPRHVEVQVFADAHGHCIHLGERDCSVQRRHQKIIEESPSPAVSPELRAELGRCAVALAQAAGYVGAGTVEFLLDEDAAGFAGRPLGEIAPEPGRDPVPPSSRGSDPRSGGAWGPHFFLMEMNTRLQVEHPVTELLTGLDLVEWQLRVARGEPLPLAQEQVRLHGHAIEVRLCAEDEHFTPHTGEILHLHPPAESASLRFDHALASGTVVTPHYDAMLGKVIAHGTSREAAIDRLLQGLRDTRVLGLHTNRALLAVCLHHPVFRAGHARIDFLAQHGDELREGLVLRDPALRAAAALAVCFAQAAPATALPCPYPRSLRLAWADGETTVGSVLELGAGQVQLTAEDGSVHRAKVQAGGASGRRITLDGVDVWAHAVLADERRWHVQLAQREVWLTDLSHAPAVAGGAEHAHRELRAPFNGKLLAVHTAAGQQVARGDPLLVVESMKLEHVLCAPRDGVVAEVLVAAGAQVAPGQTLLRLDH